MTDKADKNNKDDSLIRISQAAKICGLSKQTIHYYLMLGLIQETQRTKGGQRLFDQAILKRIKLIHKLNESGYTLQEIGETFLKKD